MRTALFMFLWIASLASYSQSPTRPVDPRWSLTVNDSLVHGPYTDFRLMAANRIVSDQMRRQAVRVMYGWMSLADNNRADAAGVGREDDVVAREHGREFGEEVFLDLRVFDHGLDDPV